METQIEVNDSFLFIQPTKGESGLSRDTTLPQYYQFFSAVCYITTTFFDTDLSSQHNTVETVVNYRTNNRRSFLTFCLFMTFSVGLLNKIRKWINREKRRCLFWKLFCLFIQVIVVVIQKYDWIQTLSGFVIAGEAIYFSWKVYT